MCDQCGTEATVHEVVIRGGKAVERHLCEACAKAQGLAPQAHLASGSIVTQAILAQATGGGAGGPDSARVAGASACPACGLTFGQFRSDGVLGCPACYDAFERPLSSLLERAHEGGTHHTGKVPRRLAGDRSRRAGGSAQAVALGIEELRRRVASIQKQLEDAVAAEQYERAVELRDELRRLGAGKEAGSAGEAGPLT